MPDTVTSSKNYRKWIRLLLSLAAAIVAVLVVFLLALPHAISSAGFKRWLERSATAALHRPVRLDTLQWRWSKGILLEKLVLADSPAFSEDPLATITRMRADLSYRALLQRRVAFEIELDGVVFNLIRQEDGQTNLEALLSQLPLGKSAPEVSPPSRHPENQESTRPPIPLVLPVDVMAQMHVNNFTLQAVDRQQERSVSASAGRFALDMPSLRREPITLEMTTQLELNQRKIPAPFLNIRIQDLFNPEGELQPAHATVDVKGAFPGGRLAVTGGMAQLNSAFDLDLAQLFEVVSPLLPAPMAATETSGRISLTAEMRGDPQQELQFLTTLTADGLKVAGGVLDTKAVGPLKLKLVNNGKLNLDEGTAAVQTGRVLIQDKSRLNWQLDSRDLKQGNPELTLTVGQMAFDLNELTTLAQDFIPADIVFDLSGGQKSATLTIEQMQFSGKPLSGPHSLRMKDLVLQLPVLTLKAADNLLTVRDMALVVKDTHWDALTQLPNEVELNGTMGIGRIHLEQPSDVRIKALQVTSMAVQLEDIRPSTEALLGYAARISLNQSLGWDELQFSDMAEIAGLRQSLTAVLNLASEPFADLKIKGFSVHTPTARFRHADWGALKTDIRLDSTLGNLHIDALAPFKADIGALTAHLQVGGFLDGNVEVRAKNLGLADLQSKGRVQLDLRQLADQVLAGLKPAWSRGLKLGGKVETTWDLVGRRPRSQELEELLSDTVQPISMVKNSAFIDRLHLSALLDQLFIDIPLSGEERLTAHKISTTQPIGLKLTRGLEAVDVDGGLHVGNISVLPNLGRLEKKLALDVNFSGRVQDLKSLRITQNMALDPVHLTQEFSLDLAGLDRILRNGRNAPLSAVLTHGQGAVQGGLKLGKDANLSFNEDFLLDGDLNAGVELQLVPGSRVSAKAWLNTDRLNARWGDLLTINTMESRLKLDKSYVLAKGARPTADPGSVLPLSQTVLIPPQTSSIPGETISRQLQADVQGGYGRAHTLKIDATTLNLETAEVKLKHQVMDFHLDEGLPRMDYLQMDLLGGTMVGAWSITRATGGFILNLQGAFSGLDTRRLLPDMEQIGADTEAEISGIVTLAVPLGKEPDTVLQGMTLNLEITQIGAYALERALFAMDPNESNEEIVNQRRQLRLGTPRWIDLEVQYGNLSINGAVEVKGVRMDIPPIERINIATLPVKAELEEILVSLQPVLTLLSAASASTLAVDPDGLPRFLD